MGIRGLLLAVNDTFQKKHLRDYANKTAAIDGYAWLHKGCFTCAQKLCTGQPTDAYVKYFVRRLEQLLYFQVEPYVVFDGGYLPSKAGEEKERAESRRIKMEKGHEYLASGDSSKAAKYFSGAVDITPEMAHRVILELRKRNIKYVVAPYEADAQMAFLCKAKLADFVISEDSDCIPYGCPSVLFKLDSTGFGDAYTRRDLVACKMNFTNWTQSNIIDMCILCGCDYLDNIKKVGVTKAHKLVSRYKSTDRVLRALHFEGSLSIPKNYEKMFAKAKLTFKHHIVFDPRSGSCTLSFHKDSPQRSNNTYKQSGTHLNPVPSDATDFDLSFCGAMIQSDIAAKIANGDIDPMTHEPFPAVSAVKKVEKDVLPTFASNLKTTNNNNNVFARRSEMKKKRKRQFLGSMEKFIRRSSKEIAFQKPRSIVTTTTTTIREQKEQVCPNSVSTERSKYFSSSSSQGTKSSTRNMLLKSLKGQNNQSNKKSKVESATQKILNRVTSATMQSDSISKRFDPISTRSSLDRFDLSSTTTSSTTSLSKKVSLNRFQMKEEEEVTSSQRDDSTSSTTSLSKKDSLNRFQMKEEEEEVTSSQRDDFQMTATLMRSPDRIVKASAVNLLDDTSFDSLESPAQVIPETPPRSLKKKKKNLKKSFAFRLSKFTFQKR